MRFFVFIIISILFVSVYSDDKSETFLDLKEKIDDVYEYDILERCQTNHWDFMDKVYMKKA